MKQNQCMTQWILQHLEPTAEPALLPKPTPPPLLLHRASEELRLPVRREPAGEEGQTDVQASRVSSEQLTKLKLQHFITETLSVCKEIWKLKEHKAAGRTEPEPNRVKLYSAALQLPDHLRGSPIVSSLKSPNFASS